MAKAAKTSPLLALKQRVSETLIASAYTYRPVALAEMFIDAEYQREILKHRVKQIRQSFNPFLFMPLVLSLRSFGERIGSYAIIDGQQRWTGIRGAISDGVASVAGITQVASLVFEDLTPEQEALIFWWLNQEQSKLSPVDEFRGRLKAQDPVAHAVHAMMHKHGFHIPGIDTVEGHNGPISAVRSMDDVYLHSRHPGAAKRLAGDKALDKTFAALTVWGANDREALQGDVIRGWGMFFGRFYDLDPYAAAQQIGKNWGPLRVKEEAGKIQKRTRGQEVRAYAIAHALTRAYNKSQVKGKYLTWPKFPSMKGAPVDAGDTDLDSDDE